MVARLAAGIWVGALMRRVHGAGGFATIVRKGDEGAGSVLLLLRARDGSQRVLSRVLRGEGYAWMTAAEADADSPQVIDSFLNKQSSYDPDLWIVELDIAVPERFIDEPIL
jgi:hypothetical protein